VVDQRAILHNHRRDIVDSGTGGDVCIMGAARRDLMVDWMVRRGIRLDSDGTTLHDFSSYSQFFVGGILTHTFIHKLCDSKINHVCVTGTGGGSDGVTDVESVDSSGTKGGFVASGEGETRGGAVNPAIRLFIAVVADASLCGSVAEV